LPKHITIGLLIGKTYNGRAMTWSSRILRKIRDIHGRAVAAFGGGYILRKLCISWRPDDFRCATCGTVHMPAACQPSRKSCSVRSGLKRICPGTTSAGPAFLIEHEVKSLIEIRRRRTCARISAT
jgi:hypothetical protein